VGGKESEGRKKDKVRKETRNRQYSEGWATESAFLTYEYRSKRLLFEPWDRTRQTLKKKSLKRVQRVGDVGKKNQTGEKSK